MEDDMITTQAPVPESDMQPVVQPDLYAANQQLQQFGFATAPSPGMADYAAASLSSIAPVPQIPKLDPQAQQRQSQIQLPLIEKSIKAQTKATFYRPTAFDTLSAQQSEAQKVRNMRYTNPTSPVNPNIRRDDVFQRLSTGEYIPRYKNYMAGVDNEDRLGRQQGTLNKWMNGLGKWAIKSSTYTAAMLASPFYVVYEIARQGNFEAVYDNDLMDLINDLDARMNYALPNYYRAGERDQSFLKNMWSSANFWANDVLGGMAYTTAAIASEAVWAGLTGGASLATSAARAAMRAAIKTSGKAFSRAAATGARSAMSGPTSLLKGYVRKMKPASNTLGAVNNARFMITSPAYEASVESNGFMREAEADFIQQYREATGNNPTQQELSDFKRQIISSGNTVFGANMAIVGLSNILMFGQYFGLGFGMVGAMDRAVGRALGLGASRVIGKAGVLQAVKPNVVQKIAGTSFNVLKRPFTEGVFEEGGQGTASRAAQAWVKAKYDPNSLDEQMTYVDALKIGAQQAFGTTEGFKEVGIGMIIGGFMGGFNGFGFREYSRQQKRIQSLTDEYNKNTIKLNTAGTNLIIRSMQANQQLSSATKADQAIESGDLATARREYDIALFTKLSIEEQLGLLDETSQDFQKFTENFTAEEIMKEQKVTLQQVEEYKKAIINDFNGRLEDYKTASKFADLVVGDNASPIFKDYISLNAFMGVRAKANMEALAQDISQAVSANGFADAARIFSTLDAEHRKLVKEYAELETALQDINGRIAVMKSGITDENTTKGIAGLILEQEKMIKRFHKVEKLISTRQNSSFNVFNFMGLNTTEAPTAPQLAEAYNMMTSLDTYVTNLRTEDPIAAETLLGLIDEYRANLVDYKSSNDMLARMRDPRFMRNEARGLAKLIKGEAEQYIEAEENYEDVIEGGFSRKNAVYKNDAAIQKAYEAGELSEDEMFTFKAYNHMLDRYQRGKKILGEGVDIDPITPQQMEEYRNGVNRDQIINSVANAVYNTGVNSLSPRQLQVYNANKNTINDIMKQRGDSPLQKLNKAAKRMHAINDPAKSVEARNNTIINDSLGLIEESEGRDKMEEYSNSIGAYNEESTKRDNGTAFNQERLDAAADSINELGAKTGVPNLIDFIDQNRLIGQSEGQIGSPVQSISAADIVSDDVPRRSNGRSSHVNTQNNNTVSAQQMNDGRWEISGLRLEKLVAILGKFGVVQMTAGGATVTFPSGQIVTLKNTNAFARIEVSDVDAQAITNNTDMLITAQRNLYPTNWVMVLYRDGNRLIPLKTGTGYGVNEADVIDDTNVLKVKEGDTTTLEIDLQDTYNLELIAKLNEANDKVEQERANYEALEADDTATPEQVQAAKSRYDAAIRARGVARDVAANNIVVKVIHGDNFVSVIRSIPDGDMSKDLNEVSTVRNNALNAIESAYAEGRTEGSVELEFQPKVDGVYPGRPNYKMTEVQPGAIDVEEIPFTEETKKKVVNIGYLLDGRFTLKERGTKFLNNPFLTKVLKAGKARYKGQKIPVAIIRHENGNNYAYPISLVNKTMSSDVQAWIDTLNDLIANPVKIDSNTIQKANVFISSLKLNPLEYQIPMSGTVGSIVQAMEKAVAQLQAVSTMPNMDEWMTSPLSVQDIAVADTRINIDLGNEPFFAPKISLNLTGAQRQDVGETVEPEAEVQPEVTEPKTPLQEARQNAGTPVVKMTKTDFKGIMNLIIGSRFEDLMSLGNHIISKFFANGPIQVDKFTLRDSGLFSENEIARITSDPKALRNLMNLFEKIRIYTEQGDPNSQIEYFTANDLGEGNVLYTGEVDTIGKSVAVNPNELGQDVANTVGGIKDRTEFDSAFNTLPYHSLVEQYNNDLEFADEMYEFYSAMTRVDVVTIENGQRVNKTNSSLSTIRTFAHPNSEELDIRRIIADVISAHESEWDAYHAVKALRKIAIRASYFGIDLGGLETMYNSRTQAEFDTFLGALDIFINQLHGNTVDFESFAAAYDAFFIGEAVTQQQAVDLSENEQSMTIVAYNGPVKDNVYMYENHSLLHIRDNLYQVVNRDANRDEIYQSVYDTAIASPRNAPKQFFAGVAENNITDPNYAPAIMRNIRAYVGINTNYNQNEDMTLMRLAFGHPITVPHPQVDIQREINRYKAAEDTDYDGYFEYEFYNFVLAEKAKNSPLYNKVLSKFNIDPENGVTLKYTDSITARNIELYMPEGEMKSRLKAYAMKSGDPTMRQLFYLADTDMEQADRYFYENLYLTRPELLPQYDGNVVKRQDGNIEAQSLTDFIRFKGDVYVKVAENGGTSIYEYAEGNRITEFKDLRSETGWAVYNGTQINDALRMTEEQKNRRTCRG